MLCLEKWGKYGRICPGCFSQFTVSIRVKSGEGEIYMSCFRGGVKGIRKVGQLMERCDGHVRGEKGCGEVLHLAVC